MIIGIDGIIKKIRDRVGTENPVYLSIDIDSIDPACLCPLNNFFTLIQSSVADSNSCPGHRNTRDWRVVYS